LFQFSGSTAANISTGNNWSTENLIITASDIGTLKLNDTSSSVPTTAISKLVYSEKDFVYEIGLTAPSGGLGGQEIEFRVPDVYNDICRWCGAPSDDANPNNDPLIVNDYICDPDNFVGFTSCFRTEVTFGHLDHPIWNGGTGEMPNIFVLSAANVAKKIANHSISNASWEWISAGSSGNSCAVLSYNITGTTTPDTKRQVLCWGPRYNKLPQTIEAKHWPQNDQQLQPHFSSESIACKADGESTLDVTWHPCQVDCSLESPIFYQKSWPFASYHIASTYEPTSCSGKACNKQIPFWAKRPTTWIYNTLAKVLVWNESQWEYKSNATIDEPLLAHNRQYEFNDYLNTSKELSKTIYFPNGLNQVQHRVFNNLPFSGPTGGGPDFEYWNDQNASFLPLIPNFTSNQTVETTYLEWLNQWWFPNWTPNYPVVSGNSWLVNLYKGEKNADIDCKQCEFTGNTGCCEVEGSECFISEYLDCQSSGGTWIDGECPAGCEFACHKINDFTEQLNFFKEAGSEAVALNNFSTACEWTSEKDAVWITVEPNSGTASLVNIEVAENTTGSRRSGTVTIQETQPPNTTKIIMVDQSDQSGGGGCGSGGNCCVANPGTAGCADTACCALVCGLLPDCCNTEWDQICANQAVQLCTACGGGGGGGGGGVGANCCNYFTGPCCKNNSCEENKTPQECYNAKGIFLGFNRTCDDCPS